MFKMIKNPETGETCIRPMLVGSIKNKYLRRFAIMAVYPFTLLVTFAINYICLAGGFVLRFVGMTFKHIGMLLQPPWKSQVWDRPRTSKDEWMQ